MQVRHLDDRRLCSQQCELHSLGLGLAVWGDPAHCSGLCDPVMDLLRLHNLPGCCTPTPAGTIELPEVAPMHNTLSADFPSWRSYAA